MFVYSQCVAAELPVSLTNNSPVVTRTATDTLTLPRCSSRGLWSVPDQQITARKDNDLLDILREQSIVILLKNDFAACR
jgi:hypothetical protein